MPAYILKGDQKELDKVIRENRIRVERGVITITPVQPETVLNSDSINTLIESHRASENECMRMAAAQVELANLAEELALIITEGGKSIPDELVARLDSFGIDVPKIAETVPESTDTAENTGESVPETVPNDSDPVDDNKIVEAEDKTEVNLGDVKDINESDTKESPAPKPKKTRTKKAEE